MWYLFFGDRGFFAAIKRFGQKHYADVTSVGWRQRFRPSLGFRKKRMIQLNVQRLGALLTLILLVGYLQVILWTFRDYGITYDENWHLTYGNYIIQWYATGFQDTSALTFWNLVYKGGFFDVLMGLSTSISPYGTFETSHLLNAFFGVLAVICTYRLGSFLAGPLVGFLATVFLLVTSRFYGHVFNNPIDIPVATLYLFSLYYLVQVIYALPNPSKLLIFKLGLAVGLALGIRIGVVLLIGYTALALGLWLATQFLIKPFDPAQNLKFKPTLIRFYYIFVAVGVIAYFVMLIWWPAAQVRPIRQPVKALLHATNFDYTFDVFFDGQFVSNAELPWYYLLKWLGITLPEYYFIALALGLFLLAWTLFQNRANLTPLINTQSISITVMLVAIIFPVAYVTITTPVDYDGIRHFLFIIPPLAVIAALSVAKFVQKVSSTWISAMVLIPVLTSITVTIVDMVRLHPYQYIYFNRLFGKGVTEAAKSFDTDYWGASYKEGVAWLVDNYPTATAENRPKVASCSYALSTSYYLPEDRFEYIGSYHDGQPISGEPDLFLATPRWNCHQTHQGTILHTVTRQEAPLLYIIEVDQNVPVEPAGK